MYLLHAERSERKRNMHKEGPAHCLRLSNSATAVLSSAKVVLFGDALVHGGDQTEISAA